MALETAIAIYKDWDKNDAGTCKYIILNEFPWTKSSGVNSSPQIIEKIYIHKEVKKIRP